MRLRSVFGDDLSNVAPFADKVSAWLAALYRDGAARTVARAAAASH
jgi:hypothetical protein